MTSDAHPRRRRRIFIGLAVLLLLMAGAAAAFFLTRPGDVSNPDVEFRAEEPTPTPLPEKPARPDQANRVTWPYYGYSADRRRSFPVARGLRGPFRKVWTFHGRVLLEFPPVMAKRSLYLLKDDGVFHALSKKTGNARWSRRLGSLAASSPAYHDKRLYMTILERSSGKGGRAVAMSAGGTELWSRNLPSRTESSPVVGGGGVYFGSENGTVYGLRESDGGVRWTFKASGAVKGGLALKEGRLFFGDYAGKVYALRARDGKLMWTSSTKGARFGLSAGRFYSTPAVAYGRVYIGNVDGNVYSFSADSGELAWRTKTSGYVYASPAVGAAPGDKPTVYAGSYDGNFYAMDARTGRVRWRYGGGSKISGGATLLGDVVYFSDLGHRRTIGLGARTGRKVFSFPRGGYNPVITDGRTLFLVGYASMYALRPLSTEQREKRAQRQREARRSERSRRRAAASRARTVRRGCARIARRNYDRQAPRRIAYRRCLLRTSRTATRRACVRIARESHDRRPARRRSVRRCVRRNR